MLYPTELHALAVARDHGYRPEAGPQAMGLP